MAEFITMKRPCTEGFKPVPIFRQFLRSLDVRVQCSSFEIKENALHHYHLFFISNTFAKVSTDSGVWDLWIYAVIFSFKRLNSWSEMGRGLRESWVEMEDRSIEEIHHSLLYTHRDFKRCTQAKKKTILTRFHRNLLSAVSWISYF